MPGLVKAAKESGASVLLIQEMGETEARDFFAAMGSEWGYDRDGLNVAGWIRKDEWTWKLSDPFDLSSFGQKQRTLLSVIMAHKAGKVVRVSSSHLAAAADDLSSGNAALARATQMNEIWAHLDVTQYPTVLAADWNNKIADRIWLQKYGWLFDKTDLTNDAKKGIDGTAVNYGATILSSTVVDLEGFSDHDGRRVVIRVP